MKIPQSWTFKSDEVASNFDNHVKEQLPWYSMATDMVASLIRAYLPNNGVILDIGCSTGNITKSIESIIFTRACTAISIDNSVEMGKQFHGVGEFILSDIEKYEIPPFDVAVCFLSIMFINVYERAVFINRLKERCRKGGAIIIVDKFSPVNGYLGTTISRITLSNKVKAGCSADEIIQKELSISGVQRPMSRLSVKDFTQWLQVGDFSGYIYEKHSED